MPVPILVPACNQLCVLAVPAFQDNYLWLIHNGTHAAVVDPGASAPVLAALAAHHLTLTAILLTHHHADHTGGVAELLQHSKVPLNIPVYGPRNEVIANVSHALSQGDQIELPELALRLSVLDVPGHTSGHIAYLTEARTSAAPACLFCGDTLFAGGCGRLFEGTPAQMMASLGKLSALAPDTLVYCAHEYTLANLRFAQEVEPNNRALQQRLRDEQAKRANGQPTLPSTIALELRTNPFLRYAEASVIEKLQDLGRLDSNSALDSFTALRAWKNTY